MNTSVSTRSSATANPALSLSPFVARGNLEVRGDAEGLL